jgi:rhodanese-related sulfurtransferase
MEQITAEELKAWLDDPSRPRPVLVDVREPWEFQVCRIPESVHMPMNTIPARAGELATDVETVLICHHGARSFQVGLYLERRGFTRLYNLFGGVDGWARSVDPTMATY